MMKLVYLFVVLMAAACTGPGSGRDIPGAPVLRQAANTVVPVDIVTELERIAEIERAGAFFPGLALAQSALMEQAGDYAGAAVAAYKELAWTYAHGAATREQVEEGLQHALVLLEDAALLIDSQRDAGGYAIRGCLAFFREDWARAQEYLEKIPDEEPDSFLRWMLLVCALEGGNEEQTFRSAYGAIRARYALFPEYWYRGARAFSLREAGSIAALYAEQCINTAPQGPYSQDCRRILAAHLGLSPNGTRGGGILTKAEIEHIIRSSVSANDPEKLQELFPLMDLPDNPYTLYALGAMQSLTAIPEYRAFFAEGAIKSAGRLGERLNFISRS